MITKIPDSYRGYQKQISSPFKFSKCKPNYLHIGSELGEHTVMVLKNIGYKRKEIEKLKKQGVCYYKN